MSNTGQMRDDLDAYIATFDEEERQELARAGAALDLAALLYQARKARGWTQKLAAKVSGVKQQAISRWERSHPNIQLDTLQRYLAALGYDLELAIKDAETGEIVATTHLPEASHSSETKAAVIEQSVESQALPLQPQQLVKYKPWLHDDPNAIPSFRPEFNAPGLTRIQRAWGPESESLAQSYATAFEVFNRSFVAAMPSSDENSVYWYVPRGWQIDPVGLAERLSNQPYQAERTRLDAAMRDLATTPPTPMVSSLVQVGA